MSGIKVGKLKSRALQFLKDAKRDLSEGVYDLSIFYAEQALQLYLKAILFELFASEIKSHEIRSMLSTLAKLLRQNEYEQLAKEIEELSREYRDKLRDLEDSSIYEDIDYDRTQAEELIDLVEKIINKLEEVSKRAKLGEG